MKIGKDDHRKCSASRYKNGGHEFVLLNDSRKSPEMSVCVDCGMLRISKGNGAVRDSMISMYETWFYFKPSAVDKPW